MPAICPGVSTADLAAVVAEDVAAAWLVWLDPESVVVPALKDTGALGADGVPVAVSRDETETPVVDGTMVA